MSAGDSISGYGLEWEAVIGRTRAAEITASVPQVGYERLVASGVPLPQACHAAIVDALTDDADTAAALAEVVAAIIGTA